jgi:hypothetical protein
LIQRLFASLLLVAIAISTASAACCQGSGTSDVPSTCPAVDGTDEKWKSTSNIECLPGLSCFKYNCVTTVSEKSSTKYYQGCSTSTLVDASILFIKSSAGSDSVSCTKSSAAMGGSVIARQGFVLSIVFAGLSGLLFAARQ